MKNSQRHLYLSRINKVIDYIDTHIDEPLSLEKLAEVASFSPYHFHRIFRGIMKENINPYIRRIRVEKAASQLLHHPDTPVLDIATSCGFNSAASFARAFKDTFKMSATEWRGLTYEQRVLTFSEHRKIGQVKRKNGKLVEVETSYLGDEFNIQWQIIMQGTTFSHVEVKELPEIHVAYIRHIGPYKGNTELFASLFGKLMQWATPRGLVRFPETKMLSIYHDDPNITDDEKLRLTVALSVPKDTPVEGEIGYMELTGGLYAVARFEINADQYEEAWQSVYGGWLPESGYEPAHSPSFESYLNNPHEHPEGKHIVEIYVPLKKI